MVWGKGLVTALAVLALSLGGCAERHYTANIVASNAAQWDSFNQLMLINVLRSRDREPRSYSHFTALRGSASLSPGLSIGIPFGPDAGATDFNPSLGASTGISDDVAPMDDQDFYQGILTPVSDKTWALYQDQSWPADILFHVFVESIKVVNTDFIKMNRAIAQVCKSNNMNGAIIDEQIEAQCKARVQRLSLLGCDGKGPSRQRVGRRIIINLANEPDDQCERAQFEAFAFGLMALGFHIEKGPSEQVGPTIPAKTFQKDLDWAFKLKDGDVSVDPVKNPRGRIVGYAVKQDGDYSPHLLNFPRQILLPQLPPKAAGKHKRAARPQFLPDRDTIETQAPTLSILPNSEIGNLDPKDLNIHITTRSPDGMLYYLGEVVRAAEEGKPDTVVQTGHSVIPLIKVVAGDRGDPAVSVGFRGSCFSVPRNQRSASMQVFELLKQVFALYNKGSGTPSTTAVTIVP